MNKNIDKDDAQKIIKIASMFIFALIIFFSLIMIGCHFLMDDYPNDNPLEEFLEDQIEKETGIEIDLSPKSKELVCFTRPIAS